ncbi:hemolysin family protein [Enterovibrio norvegicus]|uniref:hemolysin family protein n=1 Tax=Enterovibrio norvegicus TaxID=188144 RepID=UPI000C84844B|nr:hemolysin family protein [Enterovibrio norvegicus]PML79173.1 hemolysin [Enterovibrio norvegicus]PMN72424.1 hemolysin [Enterovibrio norvegicus]
MDVLLLVSLIVINGIFAMSEIALVTAKSSRLKRLAERSKAAHVALTLKENPTRFLSTIQIGITVIGLLSGIVGEATLSVPFAEWLVVMGLDVYTADIFSTACVVLAITYFAIVIGELVPKRFAQSNAERLSVLVALPIYWLSKIATPFVALLTHSTEASLRALNVSQENDDTVTEDDIQALVSEGSLSGAIEPQEHEMINNILHLNDRLVSSLMTPRRDIDFLDIDQPVDQVLKRIRTTKHSVFPVCRGNLDNVVGTVSSKAMLNQAGNLSIPVIASLLKRPVYVPESMRGLTLLNYLQRKSGELAFIVDEYGDIQGLVTHYDLLKAIAGDLSLSEEDAWAKQLPDGSWFMDGMMPIAEFKSRLNISTLLGEAEEGFQTLNGLLMWVAGRLPNEGEVISYQSWRFEIIKLAHNRIADVKMMPLMVPPKEPTKTHEAA